MPFESATFSSGPYARNWGPEGQSPLVTQICSTSQFLRGLLVQMRFGEFTRAPLRLLRLHVLDDVVECDWMARYPDPWDADLSQSIQQRHASLQTLRDAIDVRALLFSFMPWVETAHCRVYRESSNAAREMIIKGCVQRNDHSSRDVHSLVMRAKVLGFRFDMEGDTMREISIEESICIGS